MLADPAATSRPFVAARSWYAVCVLVLLFGISFTDRQILSLLAPTISEHLGISDTKIGVLFGLGFAVVYALTGLPPPSTTVKLPFVIE